MSGRNRVIDKSVKPLQMTGLTPGGVTGRPSNQLGVLPIGVYKGEARFMDLDKLINQETGRVHHVSPHRLRDAFAVHAVKLDDSGDGLRLLQEHLGHMSFNTTARYRKVAGEEHKEWYDRLWNSHKGERDAGTGHSNHKG